MHLKVSENQTEVHTIYRSVSTIYKGSAGILSELRQGMSTAGLAQ